MGYISLLTALIAMGTPHHTVVLGDKVLTADQVTAISAGLGQLKAKQSDGFYRLILNPNVDLAQAKQTLRAKGLDYVFDLGSTNVDNASLPSVRSHIAYLEAKNELKEGPGEADEQGMEKESGVDFYEALEFYLRARVGPDGRLDEDEMAYAIRQREAMPPAFMGGGPGNAPYSIWAQVGPANLTIPYATYYGTPPLSGRKSDIAVAPSDSNTIYAASAGGGVWKTVNGGTSWAPVGDRWAYLQTSSVAVHTTNKNIVLAGTGDYRGFFTAQTQGLMRTADGGVTWTQVGLPSMKSEIITKIVFNPLSPSQVVCISANSTLRNGGAAYRSTDAGLTWTETQLFNGNGDDVEVGIDGTLWSVIVKTDGSNKGVVGMSSNFGATWTAVTNPCANNQPVLDIATSKITPGTIYLLAVGDEKIYKSQNGGTSWSDITGNFPVAATFDPNYNWAQKTYDQWLGCTSNAGQDVLLCGLITIAQSVGGGAVWTDIGRSYANPGPNYSHNDQHCYAVDPNNPSTVYYGCDGGIFRYSYAAAPVGANFVSLNATIKDEQHYHVSLHPTDLSYVMGGTQDNASPASRGNLANWSNLQGGDGGWSGFDATTPANHITTSQNGAVFLYTAANAPSYTTFIGPPDNGNSWPGGFIAPAVFAGTGGSQIFLGAKDIRWWQTGTTWTSVKTLTPGIITTINTSLDDGNAMYAGTSDGKVWTSLNPTNTASWTQIDNSTFGGRSIGGIAVQPGTLLANKTQVLVGVQGTGANHLWLCTDTTAGTPIWTNVSGNLPNTPVNAVAYDPYHVNRWYVGTDIGCFMTSNGGVTWTNMAYLNLPNVRITDLRVAKNKTVMYAATFGRGIWRLQLTSIVNPFSITGTVRQVDNSPFAGVAVALKKWRETSLTYTNSTAQPIPDNNPTGITSTLNVPLAYAMTGGTLYLNISHTYIGDLLVTLVSPDGQEWVVHNHAGAGTDNIIGNFDFGGFASGLLASGTWTLKVADTANLDTGTLNSWKVIPKFFTYVTQSTTTTSGTGTYSFPGLEAGKYYVIPSFAGKTWTPAYRIMNVGPSRTLQDFKANQ